MSILGQGLVLMVAGMSIVYVFLYVLILVSEYASRFVSRFDSLLPDDSPRKRQNPASATPVQNAPEQTLSAVGTQVKAPVPGSVLRITATTGQNVANGDEILVMDVMKMETPITAPCAGLLSVNVAVMDKIATGDVVATIS